MKKCEKAKEFHDRFLKQFGFLMLVIFGRNIFHMRIAWGK